MCVCAGLKAMSPSNTAFPSEARKTTTRSGVSFADGPRPLRCEKNRPPLEANLDLHHSHVQPGIPRSQVFGCLRSRTHSAQPWPRAVATRVPNVRTGDARLPLLFGGQHRGIPANRCEGSHLPYTQTLRSQPLVPQNLGMASTPCPSCPESRPIRPEELVG